MPGSICCSICPQAIILCRSYEKTECIWTAILLHMLNNSISLLALGG